MENGLSIWKWGWALLLGLGWLLPNHYLPWTSFHTEAWVAGVFLLIVPWAWSKAPRSIPVDTFAVVLIALALIGCAQFWLGVIAYAGQLWLLGAYLLGALLAVLVGYSLGRTFIDLLSIALAIAALFSVMLQLHQWLGLDVLGIWLFDANPLFPSANLAQKNQLGSLLLWGALSFWWLLQRGMISAATAGLASMLVLGGAALTVSRTAWLAVGFIVFAAWWWRGLWCKKGTEWGVLVLALFFVSAVVFFKSVAAPGVETLLDDEVERAVNDSRLAAWTLLGTAALDAPWWGYGIGQVAKAHILLSTKFPGLGVVLAQSHNLFLDLALWLGLPIGIVFSGGLVVWLIRRAMWVKSREQAVMILYLLVMANHSMLEYPLYYAYFLLPAGAIVGVLSRSFSQSKDVCVIGRSSFAILAVFVTGMFSVIGLDYLKVENSYRLLRMEWMGFNLEAFPQPPDVIALDQWEQAILMARVEPRAGMDKSSIANLERVAFQTHRPLDFRNMAYTLLLNGHAAEAALWIERLCRLTQEGQCAMALEEFESRNTDVGLER